MVRYGIPLLEVWEGEKFEPYHIHMKTCDRINNGEPSSKQLRTECIIHILLVEELNLRIYGTYQLKHLYIPINDTCFTDVNIVKHYKQIKAIWNMIKVRDHKIQTKEEDHMREDDEVKYIL